MRNQRQPRPLDLESGGGTAAAAAGPCLPPPLRLPSFAATAFSICASVPFLVSIPYILRSIAAHQYDCAGLVKNSSFVENATITILSFLLFLFCVYFMMALEARRWLPTAGALLFLGAAVCLLGGFPRLGNKSTFDLYGSSSSPTWVTSKNNSEYWNSNIKTCECKTPACEDFIYRSFLKYKYANDVSGYTRLLPKDYQNGRQSSQQHEVCYSASEWNGRSTNKVCYNCEGCEEEYLKDRQKYVWSMGNNTYIMEFVLFASIVIIFLSDSWAWYTGTN